MVAGTPGAIGELQGMEQRKEERSKLDFRASTAGIFFNRNIL